LVALALVISSIHTSNIINNHCCGLVAQTLEYGNYSLMMVMKTTKEIKQDMILDNRKD
jgi:hypothetical protein